MSFCLGENKMNQLTDIELYAIFKECKKRFDKEPDYGRVVQLVATKLDIVPNEKLFSDVKDAFKYYKRK